MSDNMRAGYLVDKNGTTVEVVDLHARTRGGYVTPEEFGAAGDGTTDDTAAVQAAVDSGMTVKLTKQYLITAPVRITRDHTIIEGTGATVWVKKNFAFKLEARFLTLRIGKCIAVDGRGNVGSGEEPYYPAGSGFFLFDADFDIVRSDKYWYSYGYSDIWIGSAMHMEYGIRIAPMTSDTMCGLEYTHFSGNEMWCRSCITLFPHTEDPAYEGWANQNTFEGFRLRGYYGIWASSNVRTTVNGNKFVNCGIEGVDSGGTGIFCDTVCNTFEDFRNAEIESLGKENSDGTRDANWLWLGNNAEMNRFRFHTLRIDQCKIAESAYQNHFEAILVDEDRTYQAARNSNHTFRGVWIAPDCKMIWRKTAGGMIDLTGQVATPLTILSEPEYADPYIYLSAGYGHLGITEITVIIAHDETYKTLIHDASGHLLHTFNAYGTYLMRYNAYTGMWDVAQMIANYQVDSVPDGNSGNPISNAAMTAHVAAAAYGVPYTGDNLFVGASGFTSAAWVNRDKWEDAGEDVSGFPALKSTGRWHGLHQAVQAAAGQVYTFSAWVKASAKAEVRLYINSGEEGDANISGDDHNIPAVGVGTEWTRYAHTFTAWSDGIIAPRLENEVEGETLYIAAVKLERGSKATPWTDAWQDRAQTAFSAEHAGKLVYISEGGRLIPLAMGEGLEIAAGVLNTKSLLTTDETLGSPGEAADAAAVGKALTDKQDVLAPEHAGKLVYVGADGKLNPLTLGVGLAIQDGVLSLVEGDGLTVDPDGNAWIDG